MPRRSRSAQTPPRSNPAPSAGPSSSPSAPATGDGSVSTPIPTWPPAPSSDSPETVSIPAETTAPEAASDAKDEQNSRSVIQQSTDATTSTRELEILDALARRVPYREISETYRISLGSLTAIAKRTAELESGAVAKLMQTKALDAIDLWYESMVNSAKAGRHAPAKDWLLHARVLDPVQSDSGSGAKVAVIIGGQGSPVSLPNVQVLTSQSVSGDTDD